MAVAYGAHQTEARRVHRPRPHVCHGAPALARSVYLSARSLLGLLLFVLVVVAGLTWSPNTAHAQEVGIGFGAGFPFQTFVEDEVTTEFRVQPTPGNYGVLRERENALGSFHLSIFLVLRDIEFLTVFQDLEIRFDYAAFGWQNARVTHTTCAPVETFDGQVDPAGSEFLDLATARSQCLDDDYEAETDISELELPALQFFVIGVGGRARLLDLDGWTIWLSATPGFVVATFADPGAEFFLGASLSAGAGVSFKISEILTVRLLEARATVAVTEASDTIQNRLNFDTTSCFGSRCDWIGSEIMETFSWADLQFGLSFAF